MPNDIPSVSYPNPQVTAAMVSSVGDHARKDFLAKNPIRYLPSLVRDYFLRNSGADNADAQAALAEAKVLAGSLTQEALANFIEDAARTSERYRLMKEGTQGHASDLSFHGSLLLLLAGTCLFAVNPVAAVAVTAASIAAPVFGIVADVKKDSNKIDQAKKAGIAAKDIFNLNVKELLAAGKPLDIAKAEALNKSLEQISLKEAPLEKKIASPQAVKQNAPKPALMPVASDHMKKINQERMSKGVQGKIPG